MLTVELKKNEETGSAFLMVYETEEITVNGKTVSVMKMLLGLDVRADNSLEVHDWNGFAGDRVHAIHSVITDIVNGVHNQESKED